MAVTGHTEHSYTQQALSSGMNMVLYKPVNPEQVEGLISQTGYFNEEYQIEVSDDEIIDEGDIDIEMEADINDSIEDI